MKYSSVLHRFFSIPFLRNERGRPQILFTLSVLELLICKPLAGGAAQEVGNIIVLPDMPFIIQGPNYNVLTQHNNNFRTGAYLAETRLIPSEVQALGMRVKFRFPVDGGIITQPLYVRGVGFQNGGRANGIFVVTTTNWLYALDADTGNVKWKKHLEEDQNPSPRSVAQGEHTPTPVIDITNNRMYVLFKTGNKKPANDDFKTDTDAAFWLVARRLQDGEELARVNVAASVLDRDGNSVDFVAKNQMAHPALLLDRGSLYLGFGSRVDEEYQQDYLSAFHGWILQYRAADLAPQAAFCTSPNTPTRNNSFNPGLSPDDYRASGVWQGGGGLAADPDGNVYFLTGNGRLQWENGLYGDSFLKLTASNGLLTPSAYAPPDADKLEAGDADFGGGGPLVLPGSDYVLGGGKTGYMYLLDRRTMQLQQQLTAATNSFPPSFYGPDYSTVSAEDWRWNTWWSGPHLHGSPTFWPGRNLLYAWGEKDFLKVYSFDTATNSFSTLPVHTGTIHGEPHTMPGGMMSLSANGKQAGIIWAIFPVDEIPVHNKDDPRFGVKSRGKLFAYDAETLELLWGDQFGIAPHWAAPTIADGTVFVTTDVNSKEDPKHEVPVTSNGEVFAYELRR